MPRYISTNTPLDADAEWSDDISPGAADHITGSVYSDQAGDIYIEQSADGTNFDISSTYAITADDGKGFKEEVLLPYIRVRYVNGATDQTAFRLYVKTSSAGARP
jgi:hypothetical protein